MLILRQLLHIHCKAVDGMFIDHVARITMFYSSERNKAKLFLGEWLLQVTDKQPPSLVTEEVFAR